MRLVFPPQPERRMDIEDLAVGLVRKSLSSDSRWKGRSLQLGLSNLVPVFSLSVSAAAHQGGSIAHAELLAWRSVLFSGKEMLGEVEYDQPEKGVVGIPIGFRQGPPCSGFLEAVGILAADQEHGNGAWEIALLVVEGLYIQALWLQERPGCDEWFVPIPPVSRKLDAFRFYSRFEIEQILRDLATRRMSFSQTL